MEYRRFNNNIIARIDKGEEIVACLTEIVEKEGIKLGSVGAVGAVGYMKAGLFDPKKKQYSVNIFERDMEIVSLTGNITRKNGEPYLHIHIAASDIGGRVVGGHLNEGRVSLTCEAVICIFDGEAGREFDEGVGLNLLKFDS
ncbi:MAG: DNA-binding protein [Clostridiales bacterium]|jgi:predicted DNA-binding protein with PD1-like motif|nr:DNA-binding protein [Clostridiales bacterium]